MGNDEALFGPYRGARTSPNVAALSLTESQQHACAEVKWLVEGFASSAPGEAGHDLESSERAPRAKRWGVEVSGYSPVAQVVLLDGPRGVGKTTVMTSLLRGWAEALDDAAGTLGRRVAKGESTVVVPLPVLDLQPISRRAQLAALILGMFEGLARGLLTRDEFERSGDRCDRGDGWLPAGVRPKTSLLVGAREQAFRAAAAWAGYALERRERLEVDEFWRDLAEESALLGGVERALGGYVGALSGAVRAELPQGASPVFVLPIDDADMNPRRCGELIEVLRAFYHPRVVFLLTGDTDLFDTVLRRHMLGALWEPLRNLPGQAMGRLIDQDLYVAKVAREAYDRTIPARHRVRLQRASAPERWPEATGAQRTPFDDLAHLLRFHTRHLVAPDAHPLRVYFAPPDGDRLGATDEERSELGTPVPTPRAVGALPDRLRDVRSLLEHLVTRADRERSPESPTSGLSLAAHFVALRLWRSAVERSELEPATRRELIDLVQLVSRGSDPALIVYRGGALRWSAEAHVLAEWQYQPFATLELRSPAARGLRLIEMSDAGDRDYGPALADSLRLVTDLAAETPRGFVGDVLRYPRRAGQYFASRLAFPDLPTFTMPWPLPPWRQFLTYDWFFARWEILTHRPRDPAEQVRDLFNAILDASEIVAGVSAADAPRVAWRDRSWGEIRAEAQRGRSFARAEQALSREWIRNEALVVLAPEFGLPADAARTILDALVGAELEPEVAARLRTARDTAHAELVESLPEELRERARHALEDIDTRYAEHPFLRALVGNARTPSLRPPPTQLSPLEAWLAETPVGPDAAGWASRGTNLLEYASTTEDRAALLHNAGDAELVAAARVRAETGGVELVLRATLGEAVSRGLEVALAVAHEAASRAGQTHLGEAFDSNEWVGVLTGDRRDRAPHALVWDAAEASAGVVRLREGGLQVFPPAPEVSPVRAALILHARLVLDLYADASDKPQGWWKWHGVQVADPHGPVRLLPWPDPGFDAPVDHELLTSGLQAVARSKQLVGGDAAAWSYIRLTRSVFRRRRTEDVHLASYDESLASQRWSSELEDTLRTHRTDPPKREPSTRSVRWEAFDAWRRRIPLLATPECGISTECARILLDWWRIKSPGLLGVAWPEQVRQLKRWRRERWVETHDDAPLPPHDDNAPWAEIEADGSGPTTVGG